MSQLRPSACPVLRLPHVVERGRKTFDRRRDPHQNRPRVRSQTSVSIHLRRSSSPSSACGLYRARSWTVVTSGLRARRTETHRPKKSVVLQTGLENVPQESYAHVLTVMPSFHFFRLCVFFFSLLPPHLERPIPISTRDVSRRGIIEFYTKGVFITNDSSGLRLFPHSGLIDVTFPSSTCARVRFCPFPTATCAVSLFIRVILSFRCIKFSFENEKARRLGAGTLVALVPLLMYYNPLLTLVKTGDVRLIPRPFVFISRCFTAPQLEFSRAVLSRSGLTVADRSNRTPFIINTDYNEHPRLSGVYITYHVWIFSHTPVAEWRKRQPIRLDIILLDAVCLLIYLRLIRV